MVFVKTLKTSSNNTRICTHCKTEKDINLFAYRNSTNPRGLCKPCRNKQVRNNWNKLRERIFSHYGWTCVCCGEKERTFLCLDHINNDGYLDKNPNGDKKSGKELYLLVEKQGYPAKYQTLCHNCNFGKKVKGICPHKK